MGGILFAIWVKWFDYIVLSGKSSVDFYSVEC